MTPRRLVAQGRNWRAYRPARPIAAASPRPFADAVPLARDALGRFAAGGADRPKATKYRDPLTGQFTKTPEPGRVFVSIPQARADRAGIIVVRRYVDTGDVNPEPVGVRAAWPAYRLAWHRGEARAGEVRQYEADLAAELLAELSPKRQAEWERDQMEAQYLSDRAKRGAHSKKRNAAARAIAPSAQSGLRKKAG